MLQIKKANKTKMKKRNKHTRDIRQHILFERNKVERGKHTEQNAQRG